MQTLVYLPVSRNPGIVCPALVFVYRIPLTIRSQSAAPFCVSHHSLSTMETGTFTSYER